ncbi:MAG TPA: glycosyltransferase family 2 protein, partial [Segeticoccus sp.]|nr:glycosyltransferase family 2 protein [Segeticoccus sp.]
MSTEPAPEAPGELSSVAVVLPILNEERHLEEAVDAILEQDYDGPVQVVLALGPSHDRTDEIAEKLAERHPEVRTVRNPSGRTPDALNAALAASESDVVVRVDGHGVLDRGYVRTAVDLLRSTGAANVGGVMAAEGATPFERAVAAAMTSRLGVGSAQFHTGGQSGPADTVYLGVFRREWLRRMGGYDPRFVRAQDWELNHRIREAGGLVWFDPRLRVSYRPRGS